MRKHKMLLHGFQVTWLLNDSGFAAAWFPSNLVVE